MKYAVVRITGHQYKVSEGDEVLVDRLAEQKVEPEVLLVVDGDKVSVGKPKVSGAKVTVKVLGEEKGEKIDVLKYKAKSRYRKHIGFRPQYTRLLVEKVSI
ncbi:50S ribosomal protein L21 [Candidatus Woesebacteria bacterium RIFOXYB1_FULL_40_26]|uniref:Large ribosomal subunit protein bL21 n=2 Tax=Candidatus Woeseibacteriota TaxID=1752722 RepID=A0A1F8DGB9_9BACT|nr:MAG: 50S ribosomal protein L21 [Candidatus Woesebacteria bacterium RIFOXYB1_FULL_40_26]OGM87647.1 MAG: 50S ribosomal protein L21 [Candidatus Woesebacteria bacterium RIFOXYD1_FULL_40_21]